MRLDVHHYVHLDSGVISAQEQLLTLVETMMTKVQDVQAKITALQAAVEAETTVDASVVKLVEGLTATVSDLKTKLDDAIANNDTAGLQAVADGLDTAIASLQSDTQTLSDAVTANTPAAPTA